MSIFSHLIFDTNAFRYLDELGLLDVCLEAVESPLTLDMIRDIELKKTLLGGCGLSRGCCFVSG